MTVVVGATAAVRRVWSAEAALADGDLAAARGRADEAVSTTTGWYSAMALTVRARVAIAAGELQPAERDAHDALVLGAGMKAYLLVPDILECLAVLADQAGGHRDAVRLCGATQGIRERIGSARFKIYDAGYQASMAALRDAMVRTTLNPRGPRARPCPPRRPSPTARSGVSGQRPDGAPTPASRSWRRCS
jgi:hypothetical protein